MKTALRFNSRTVFGSTDIKSVTVFYHYGYRFQCLFYKLTHKFMSKKSKTFLVGRNAKTGLLTTVAKARRYANTHIVERMPKSGYGDTL